MVVVVERLTVSGNFGVSLSIKINLMIFIALRINWFKIVRIDELLVSI